MKITQLPTLVADYTIGTFIVMTFLSIAERRALRDQAPDRGERRRRGRRIGRN